MGLFWWLGVLVSNDVAEQTLGAWDPAWLVAPDLVLFVGASGWTAAKGERGTGAVVTLWSWMVTIGLFVQALSTQRAGVGALLMLAAACGSSVALIALTTGHIPLSWLFIGPFVFREAVTSSNVRHLANSLLQLVFFWTLFLVALPFGFDFGERQMNVDVPWLKGLETVGIILLIIGSMLGLWSCCSMAWLGHGTPLPAMTASELVIAGPYLWVRNPMAIAGATQTAGVGLWLGSWSVLGLAVAGGMIWNFAIRPTEEADLAERFGQPYEAYRTTVSCWIPKVLLSQRTN